MPLSRRRRSLLVLTAAASVCLAGQQSASAAPPPPEQGPAPTRQAVTLTGTAPIRPSTPPPPRSSGNASAPVRGQASSTEAEPVIEQDGPPPDLSGTWGYSRRATRQPRYIRSGRSTVSSAPNPIGFYSGVSVAGNHVPPRPPQNFDAKPATLTWAGFERAHEGSRVFFQLNATPQYSVEHGALTVVIRLRNTNVNVRNNMRALDLRYFKTPVRTVKVRRKGKDTTAWISLKREADADVTIVDGKEGYKLLVVQFADVIESEVRVDPTQKRQTTPKVAPLPAAGGN